MKTICIILRRCLTLFLVWMLTQLGPVQELRLFSGGLISTATAGAEAPPRQASAIDDRLPDCANYKTKGGEAPKGDKCTIKDASIDDSNNAWMISEGYVSTLITWAVAMIFMYQILRCRVPGVSCGYSTLFSSIGAIALFAGEIASVVGYALAIGNIKKKVEYRPDQIRGKQDQCAAGAIGSGSGSGSIGDISACDQMDYLKAQQDALGSAKTAATWKFALAIASAVCFGVAAVIEAVAWATDNASDMAAIATGEYARGYMIAATPICSAKGPVLGPPCMVGCQACATAVGASLAQYYQLVQLKNTIAPMVSQADCSRYRITVTSAEATATTACLASAAPSPECYTSSVAFSAWLHKLYVAMMCPNPNACILACAVVGTMITKRDPNDFYDVKRKTCGIEQTDILQLPSAQLQQGYGELSLNHYLNVSKLPDIFFKSTAPSVSFLLNEDEVARETAQIRTEINLKNQQEQFSLNDYRKVRQFYGDEMLADSQFSFLKIILDNATAETKKDDKNESSGMPVNQVIGSSLGIAGAAVLVFIGLLKSTDVAADGMFSTPCKRFLWNTAAAALAAVQATYTKLTVINKLDEEIGKIQTILDLKAGTNTTVGAGDSTTIPYNEVSVDSTFFQPPPPLPGTQTYPCAAGGDGKGGCKDVSNAMDATLGSLDLSSLSGLAGSLKTLNNGIGGKKTMSTGTMNTASAMANAARGVKKKIGELQAKINKSRTDKNQAPIDFAGLQNKTLKGLFKGAKDYLASKGMSAASMMPNSPVASMSEKDVEKKLAEELAKGKAAPAAGGAPAGGIGDLNFENPAAETAAGLEAGAETAPVKELDGSFQVPNNDIGSDANADIFQMLSSRYLKSAYPVFFEEEKAPAPAKAP